MELVETGTVATGRYTRLGTGALDCVVAPDRTRVICLDVEITATLARNAALYVAPAIDGPLALPPADAFALVVNAPPKGGEVTGRTGFQFHIEGPARDPGPPAGQTDPTPPDPAIAAARTAARDASLLGHIRVGASRIALWYRVTDGTATITRAVATLREHDGE